ncbi:DUF5133 domain-containing protein [Streptomyces sp. NPDC058623]|uniref:DUF5133 domain-containing protein n=1 Tax=Streptomyces sp. NPDC058623 TaxID=3346563 RepID=UPI00364D7D52
MSEPGLRTQQPAPAPARSAKPFPGHFPGHDAVARALGLLMASTPCTARHARLILATAADLAQVTVAELAGAMARAPGEGPASAPGRVVRALHRAVEAARTPAAPTPGATPPPSRTRTEEVLSRLRGCQARLTNTPHDPGAVRAMDDAAHTLCVLMGRPSAHEAVLAAERHLAEAT